ncbi:hypothetical protein [Prosthecobacter sp.]
MKLPTAGPPHRHCPNSRRSCDGKLLRYRLWSVGFDGKDDTGKMNVTKPGDSSVLRKSGYLGEWAWQYEPMK